MLGWIRAWVSRLRERRRVRRQVEAWTLASWRKISDMRRLVVRNRGRDEEDAP